METLQRTLWSEHNEVLWNDSGSSIPFDSESETLIIKNSGVGSVSWYEVPAFS